MTTRSEAPFSEPLRVLSLFSGIGGIDLGLERAGMRVVAHSEIDPYACKVLAKHWPHVPNLGDITQVRWENDGPSDTGGWWAWPADVEIGRIDVIAGGFPCQDISLAGKGGGIKEGTRSGLWSEYARGIRELRPRYVIVENVAALAARGLDIVLGDLSTLGYAAWWDCIPAASVGAPHRRDRLFIVATRADVAPFDTDTSPMQWAAQQRSEPHGDTAGAAANAGSEGRRQDTGSAFSDESADAGRAAALDHIFGGTAQGVAGAGWAAAYAGSVEHEGHREAQRGARAEGIHGRPAGHWSTEPGVGRVAAGIPRRVDRLRCLGNAVVPQVAQYIGELVVAHHQSKGAAHAA